MRKQILIIDCNLYLRKCAYKGSGLKSNSGEHCGGVYLFLKFFRSIRNKFGGDIIAVFDGGHSKDRKTLFPEYKLKDDPLPEDEMSAEEYALHQTNLFSFRNLPRFLDMMGKRVVRVGGEEADDVIFILAKHLSKDHTVQVVSGDYDYLQMVDENISVYNDNLERNVSPSNWIEVMEMNHCYYTLYKALIGDGSDGIPGIPGIGDKTAKKIISQLGMNDTNDINSPLSALMDWFSVGDTNLKIKVSEHFKIIKRNYMLMDLRFISQATIDKVLDYYYGLPPVEAFHKELAQKLISLDIKTYGELIF